MSKKHEFLHNHPNTEQMLKVDRNHVIVDKEDWEFAKSLGKIPHLEFAEWISKNMWTHWENTSKGYYKASGWYNSYNIKAVEEILNTEQLYEKFLKERNNS